MTDNASPDGPSEETPEETIDDAGAPETVDSEKAAEEAQTYRGDHVCARPLPRPAPMLTLMLPGTIDFGDQPPSSPQEQQVRERVTALAAANAVARKRSLEALGNWFPGHDFEAASQTTDDRRFAVLNIGDALFEYLDALATVERLLVNHDHPGNRMIFSHGDKRGEEPPRAIDPLRPGLRRVRVGPLVEAMSQRWTTILNGVDELDPKIALVLEHLERAYGSRVNTNVYISWGDSRGFGPHWDMHDTIIVQAAGTKTWKVYEPTTLSPLRPWVGPAVSPRPVWEGDISPGMCLVIPRGWGHEVLGSDDLAVHYTIGVNRITVQDALERLTTEGGYSPLFRADLAYDPSVSATSYDKSVHDDDVLTTAIAELATPAMIERALATYRARMPMRIFPRLFDAWVAAGLGDWSGATVRMAAPAGVHLVAITPQAATVAVADQLVDLTPMALAVVTALADCAEHGVDELCPDVESEQRLAIVTELCRAGLIEATIP